MPLKPGFVILIRRFVCQSAQVTRSSHPKRLASLHVIVLNRSISASSHHSSRNHALTPRHSLESTGTLSTPISHLLEPWRHLPSMRIARTNIPIRRLRSPIVSRRPQIQPRKRLTRNRHPDLHQHTLNRTHRTPSAIRQQLHAHGTTQHDMAASALVEGEEAGPDDADVGRREGVVFVEAHLEDDGFDGLLLHVVDEWQLGAFDVEDVEAGGGGGSGSSP